MKSFYECTFFTTEWEETRFFSVNQQEIRLKKALQGGNHTFEILEVVYSCEWNRSEEWVLDAPCVLIPIKDNRDLLSITIKNIKDNCINKICNIIVIDDRSTENIKEIVLQNKFSYLRVDNNKGFNFSMLNNIAAKVCYTLGTSTIILWNSDLWAANEKWFPLLLAKHKNSSSTISGTKLLYPPEEISLNKGDTGNILLHFPNKLGSWRETVQFGGGEWVNTSAFSPLILSPIHAKRFRDKHNVLVNKDSITSFITGALQVIDLNWFIYTGGLNPSLSKVFQDVDMCLRAIEENKKVMYFGEDMYFYHDESATLIKENKVDLQYDSDHILFSKIWNSKIQELIYG